MIMKKIFFKILIIVIISVILFSPYLLIIDFNRFSPFVFTVWFFCVLYFLFLKKKVDQRINFNRDMDSNNPVDKSK